MTIADRSPDAIRYVLLRKLASGMRHRVLGDLQTIEFTAELCSRLSKASASSDEIRVHLSSIQAQTGTAAATCRSIAEWLRPDESAFAPFGETLAECLSSCSDDWTLRGIVATVDVDDATRAALVSRQAVRELVAVSLLALIDLYPVALDLVLSAESAADQLRLNLEARTTTREASLPSVVVYVKLDWDDVRLLAEAHAVPCICQPERRSIALIFPRGKRG